MEWNKDLFLQNVKMLQDKKGWTQSDVEKASDIYKGFFSKMKGEFSTMQPNAEQLLKLSELFGCTIDELLKEEINNIGEEEMYVLSFIDKLEGYLASEKHKWQEIKTDKMLESKGATREYVRADKFKDQFDEKSLQSLYDMLGPSEGLTFGDINDGVPPMLSYKENKDGIGMVYFDSPFYSGKCGVKGCAYYTEVDYLKFLYLLKVEMNGETGYELYLVDRYVIDTRAQLWFTTLYFGNLKPYEDYDPNDCFNGKIRTVDTIEPICNSYNETMKKRMEHLYNMVDRKMHRPKLTEDLKGRLDSIFDKQ